MNKRGQVLLASVAVHAVALAAIVWAVRGVDAFRLVGVWITISGASVAIAIEALQQERDGTTDQRLFATLGSLGLLVLVVFATLRVEGGPRVPIAAVLIGVGMTLRMMASQPPSEGRALPQPVARYGNEIGHVVVGGGFALLTNTAIGLALWVGLIALALLRIRLRQVNRKPS